MKVFLIYLKKIARYSLELSFKMMVIFGVLVPLKKNSSIVVSLTTFPSRGIKIIWTVLSLRLQLERVAVIYVVLYKEEYKSSSLGALVLALKILCVKIIYDGENKKAFKKFTALFTLGVDSYEYYLIADDDVIYSPLLVKNLMSEIRCGAIDICGARGLLPVWCNLENRFSSYEKWLPIQKTVEAESLLLTGVGGVIFKIDTLVKVFEKASECKIDRRDFYAADDIFIWIFSTFIKSNIKCLGVTLYFDQKGMSENSGLYLKNVHAGGNDYLISKYSYLISE